MKVIEKKQKLKEILKEGSFEHNQEFLMSILQNHPDKEKIKNAVKIIPNNINDEYCMVLNDGNVETVSLINKCCSGKNDKSQNIKEAMRQEIRCQTLNFRLKMGYGGMGDTTHVGHGKGEKSFNYISKEFLKINPHIKVVKKSVMGNIQNKVYTFEDIELAEKWRKFHEDHCELKMQTAEENMKEGY